MAKKENEVKHKWRKCPLGQHWRGPSDIDKHKRKRSITSNSLGYKRGNDFDHLIDGWVTYWNDILKPKVPLDPDFVKVMIATESSFDSKSTAFAGKRAGHARGLMQVTEPWQVKKYNKKYFPDYDNRFVKI